MYCTTVLHVLPWYLEGTRNNMGQVTGGGAKKNEQTNRVTLRVRVNVTEEKTNNFFSCLMN